MSGHTPGPWTYSGGYPAFVLAPDEYEVGNALKAMVCNLDSRLEEYQRPQPEVDANGWLIAAAPELLEAARQALGRIESDIESPRGKTHEGNLLRVAIAKAEGGE